jgi:hypothetical protein
MKCDYCQDKKYFQDCVKIRTIDNKIICSGCFVAEGKIAVDDYYTEIRNLSKLYGELRS